MSYENSVAQFGMNDKRRRSRLAMFELRNQDHAIAQQLQIKVIAPHVDHIISTFYDKLTENADAKVILTQSGLIEKLLGTMKQYLLTLGVMFDDENYFNHRLFIGVVHAQVGISLPLYISAYRVLQQTMIDLVSDDWVDRHELVRFIVKITSFDMSLAADAYHRAEVIELESRLEKMKTRTKRLKTQLEIDSLTQVLNRTSVQVVLERSLAKVRANDGSACLIMGDIDHFKLVNDKYGHIVGDTVLINVAKRIKHCLRDEDAVGRYGGEEFLIVLNDVELTEAHIIAERIRNQVATDTVKSGQSSIAVTISLGLVALKSEDNARTAIERADAAMYKAKSNGRNRVEVE